MTYQQNIAIADTRDYLAALATAEQRALHSFFDQHIILDDDHHYYALDEGDYNALPKHLERSVIETIHGAMNDDF